MEKLGLQDTEVLAEAKKEEEKGLNVKIVLAAFFLGDSKEMQLPAWEP